MEILQDKAAEGVGPLSAADALLIPQQLRAEGCGWLSTAHTLAFMGAERRGGCPGCVCAGVAGKRGSERGANWCLVKELVMGRLGGCATGRRAVTGRVGAVPGVAG